MAESNGLGTMTTQVSNGQELIHDANVSGQGVPTHLPQRAAQTYINVATGQKYEWWGGAWH